MLRKNERRAAAGAAELTDAAFEKAFPTAWDHLTQPTWEDGSPRKMSTIGIYPERGIIRVLFRDVDAGLMTWIAVTRLSDLWPAVEAVLLDTGADWRIDRKSSADVAKRVLLPPPGPNSVDKRNGKRQNR